MNQNQEIYQRAELQAEQFYNLIQQYEVALFSSSPTDDCVYYIYVEPDKISLDFSGTDLCYILRIEVDDGKTTGGLIIKGAVFNCKIYKTKNENDETLSIIFQSDMMGGQSYLVLKK